jgi:type I restriction enzyme, S subunit
MIPPGYKQTDIGVIPEEWEVHPLRTCLIAPPDYDINAAAVPFSDKLPKYIRITDITEEGRFSSEKPVSVNHADSESYYLRDGDVVFARTGASVGKSYRYELKDGTLVFAGFLIRVGPDKNKLLSEYLAAYATTGPYWNWVKLMSMRSGQPGINGQEYGRLPVPLPPLPEQRAIAAALSDVDGLLGALDRLIAKKRDLKQAAMQQLLTGQTRLPGFHGEWEVKRLGDVVQIKKGQLITSSTLMPGDIPVIAGGKQPAYYHASANRSGRTVTISASGASAGYVALYDEPIFASDCSTINESESYCLDFVFYQLLCKQQTIYQAQTGGAQPHIHAKDLNPILFSFPPLPEQTAIVSVLSEMDGELVVLEQRREKTRALKQAMMQELLTGRTRLA